MLPSEQSWMVACATWLGMRHRPRRGVHSPAQVSSEPHAQSLRGQSWGRNRGCH